MLITEFKKNGIKFLELHGKIDGSATDFDKELADMVVGENKIIVDCSELNFISSLGLRAFLSAVKTVSNSNGTIAICNLSQPITEVFKMAGLTKIFQIYSNIDEAIESFN
jgi:anti-anti-sigma factor